MYCVALIYCLSSNNTYKLTISFDLVSIFFFPYSKIVQREQKTAQTPPKKTSLFQTKIDRIGIHSLNNTLETGLEMAYNVHHPDSPSSLPYFSEQIPTNIQRDQSTVKQTFLLSPTPSEESLCVESPVLPSFCEQDDSTDSISSTFVSTDETMVAETVSWTYTAPRMSDILPENMDLYAEPEEPCTRRPSASSSSPLLPPSPSPAEYQQQNFKEHEWKLGPEVQCNLPIVNDADFPYYPLPSSSSSSSFSPPIDPISGKVKLEMDGKTPQPVKRGVRGFGLGKFLKCVFRRYGVKRV
jgi:hypothetical protein